MTRSTLALLFSLILLVVLSWTAGVASVDPHTQFVTVGVPVEDYNNLADDFNALAEDYNTLQTVTPGPTPTPVTIYPDLQHFQTVEELRRWLALDRTDEHLYVPRHYVCHNYARDLQQAAADDGYLLSTEIVENGTHMICTAYTTQMHVLYFVDPQTDRVWFCEGEYP